MFRSACAGLGDTIDSRDLENGAMIKRPQRLRVRGGLEVDKLRCRKEILTLGRPVGASAYSNLS